MYFVYTNITIVQKEKQKLENTVETTLNQPTNKRTKTPNVLTKEVKDFYKDNNKTIKQQRNQRR